MKDENKSLKEFLQEILKKIKAENAIPVVEPDKKVKPQEPITPTIPQRRRKLLPDKWPEKTPMPKPKAENKEIISINEFFKNLKTFKEKDRMKFLVSENTEIRQEMSMNFDDPYGKKPHPSVIAGIEGEKETPFSNLNFFNGGIIDYSTLEKLGSEEFNKIIKDIAPYGEFNMNDFQKAFSLMFLLESPHKEKLEKLAIKKVKNQFGLPDEITDKIIAKLSNKIENSDKETDDIVNEISKDLNFTPEEESIINQHVEKRIIQNALMMGSGYRAHSIFNSIKDDLDKIDDKLFPLYEKTMPNVALFMWEFPFEDYMNKASLMGISKLKKDENGEIKAEATANIFPILLHETAKAAIELLFANYIIDLTEKYGEKISSEVIRRSDVFEQEIWMKRIGPSLWKHLHDAIDYVIVHDRQGNYTLVSYLLHDISIMEPEDFIKFMNIIVYNGEKSISIINKMIDDIESDLNSEELKPLEINDSQLSNTINQIKDEITDLSNAAKEKIEYDIEIPFDKMDLEQLKSELTKAIGDERYEDAAIITKLMKSKNN